MFAKTEFHGQAPNPAPDEQQQGRQSEPISNRNLARDGAQLKFDAKPGRTPNEHYDGIKKDRLHWCVTTGNSTKLLLSPLLNTLIVAFL
jgi:hypothetical protein